MQSTLAKYMNKNYKDVITDLEVVQGTARDSGNIYYAIEITFVNGFKKRLFLQSAEEFAWTNAFETLSVANQFGLGE